FNEGNSISIEEWLHWTARLDSLAPRNVEEIPEESPIEGAETFEVTLEGYLVAWKYEHSNSIFEKDNDFHLEIASSPDWNSDHVIVEVPPGPNYCDARRTAWALVQSDARKAGTSIGSTIHLFQSPVKVLVRGYVFLDATHGQPCDEDNQSFSSCNGGRGIKVRGPSQVKGLWELHPVVALIPID
ncbi:MAG: hypothetical protein KDC45_12430, partial [Bacteroidetes bacterium]|nr:hypothetical protein [Bacteroidota bacterium]